MIPVKCIHCGYAWSTKSQACTVTCPHCGLKVRIRASPSSKPIIKAPPSLRRLRAAMKNQDPELQKGQALSYAVSRSQATETIRGLIKRQPYKQIETETIITPAPKRHEVRPLVAREVVGNCKYCQKPLREKPQLNVMVNEKTRYHSTCFLSKIIFESNGDLQAASRLWNVPLEKLQQRAIKLQRLGKLPN